MQKVNFRVVIEDIHSRPARRMNPQSTFLTDVPKGMCSKTKYRIETLSLSLKTLELDRSELNRNEVRRDMSIVWPPHDCPSLHLVGSCATQLFAVSKSHFTHSLILPLLDVIQVSVRELQPNR